MFRTKKELDAHIRDTMAKIPSEKERALRCFSFARAYVSLREFASARGYLQTYLQSSPPNPVEAHKLLGDVLVELSAEEEAFEHYKKSYEIGKTRDVLNRICSLLQNGYGVKETLQSRTQWLNLQKATSSVQIQDYDVKAPYIVDSPSVKGFNSPRSVIPNSGLFSSNFFTQPTSSPRNLTKMKTLPNNTNENIGENLTKLIESNKANVLHHITLIQFYLTDKKVQQAAAHVHKYMIKYASNYEFLEKSMTVMEEAITEHEDLSRIVKGTLLSEVELFSSYFFILDNFIALLLDKNLKDVIPEAVGEKRINLAARWLHKFDQSLLTRGRKVKFSPLESWWPLFLKHCRSQLTFFMGILCLLRHDKDSKHENLFQPCFTLASSYVVDQPISLIKLRDPKLQQRAFIESCYRVLVCQILLSNVKKPATLTADLKTLIYTRCFPPEEESSYSKLKNSSEFLSITSDQKLNKHGGASASPVNQQQSDEKFWLQLKVAQLLYPESLHHQVWLQARVIEKNLVENSSHDPESEAVLLHSVAFEDIPISTPRDKADADSICQQDVDSFLTLSTYQAWETTLKKGPKQIPHLSLNLVTDSQGKWWSSASRLTHGVTDGSSDWAITEYRSQVQRGLEMIRNAESTLPAYYLNIIGVAFTNAAMKLERTGVAKQFLHLSVSLTDLYQIYFEAAELGYKMLVDLTINQAEEGKSKKKSFVRFLDVKTFPELSNQKSLVVEKARFVLGWRAMERRDFETALAHFEATSFPESSMFAAEIYSILADEEFEMSSNTDSGVKHKALLQKAQELLYETVDRKQKKPLDYYLGKCNLDTPKAPLPHPKVEEQQALHEMMDDIEEKLKGLALHMNASFNSFNQSLNGGSASFLGDLEDHRLSGGDSIRHPLDEPTFSIKTPTQKGRRSKIQQSSTPKGFVDSSTPKKSEAGYDQGDGRGGSPQNEFSAELSYPFEESLEKVLEQNTVILDTISQMEDEIKDLNDRFTMLKKSKKFVQKKNPTRTVTFDS